MRIIFMGTAPFACPTLRTLLASPHQIVRRRHAAGSSAWEGQHATASAVKALALEHHANHLCSQQVCVQQRWSTHWPPMRPEVIVVRGVWQSYCRRLLRAATVRLYQCTCLFAPQIPRGCPGALGPHPWGNGYRLYHHADGRASRHRANAAGVRACPIAPEDDALSLGARPRRGWGRGMT